MSCENQQIYRVVNCVFGDDGGSGVVDGRQRRPAVVPRRLVVVGRHQPTAAAARRRLLRDGRAQAVPEGLEEVERERRPAQDGHRPAGDARRRRRRWRRRSVVDRRHSVELGRVRAARRRHQGTGAQHAVYQLRRGMLASAIYIFIFILRKRYN